MKLNRYLFTLQLLTISILYGENLSYAYHDIHTLTPKKGELYVSYSQLFMNDTVDLLKLKERTFGSNSNFSSIGDLKGYELKSRYAITDSLLLNFSITNQVISYGSNNLNNLNQDLFLRYNFFNNKYSKLNGGLSLDIGFVTNKLKDFYIRDTKEIYNLVNRIYGNSLLNIQTYKASDPEVIFGFKKEGDGYIDNILTPNDPNDKLDIDKDQPWLMLNSLGFDWAALKNTGDVSSYIRLVTGFYDEDSVTDFYIGIKQTEIDGIITTNDTILQLAKASGYDDITQYMQRKEKMVFVGVNFTQELGDYIYELAVEYDKFYRDIGLNYVDYNVILDSSLSYELNKNTLIFGSVKYMYRQFNGQIPYLYNEYTQTTYDNNYGYVKFGLQYRF